MISACLSFPGTVFVHNFFIKKTWYVNDGGWPTVKKKHCLIYFVPNPKHTV